MSLDLLAKAVSNFRPATGTFVVGVTGSVASGKSTLAVALAAMLGPRVELVATDGFLLPNAVLDNRGLTMKKGYPESYDLVALAAALTGVRAGPAIYPAYSHVTYDIDPAGARALDRPDTLIIEGLALGLDRPPAPGLIDCLIYLEADEAFLEAWFVTRFMGFWEAAADDPASFYARFRTLDRAGAENLARSVWAAINLPNLREHIAPVRAHADLVVVKGADHAIVDIIGSP
ncbi:MAG: type I pantothenate kinase [Caulobacteraceae bacterium]